MAEGPIDAPLLVVMTTKPGEGMEAWFYKMVSQKAKIPKSDMRFVYLLEEKPKGLGGKPKKEQLRNNLPRFAAEIKESKPKVVFALDSLPLYYLTGIKESIFESRGYVIDQKFFRPIQFENYEQIGEYKTSNKTRGVKKGDPKYKWVNRATNEMLTNFTGVIIPSFSLDYIRKQQFIVTPAFKEDALRVKRALDGTLKRVDASLVYYTDFHHIVSDGVRLSVGLSLRDINWGNIIAVDIETHGIDNDVIDRVSISDGTVTASIKWDLNAINLLNDIFSRSDRIFALHNSPFDLPRLRANGVEISDRCLATQIYDTMYAAVTLQPDLLKGLGAASTLYLDCEPWKWKCLSQSDPIFYSAKDAFITALLAKQEIAVMKNLGAWELFTGGPSNPGPGIMATLPVLTDMTRRGIKTNKTYANWWTPKLERRLFRLEKLWAKMFPHINPHSPKQLQQLLYEQWQLPVQESRKGNVSTDELSMVRLQTYISIASKDDQGAWRNDRNCNDRTFDLLLRIRDVSKTLSTYVQPVAENENKYIHPEYLPVSKDDQNERSGNLLSKGNTSTGRLATYRPNIGNQPKKVRRLYVPDTVDDVFVQGDWKSAELWVLAYSAGDQVFLDDLRSADLHQRNADRFNITRKVSKNVMYARNYLAGASKISEMILAQEHMYVPVDECKRISDGMAKAYYVTEAYKRYLVELSESKYYIKNAFGRIRYFYGNSGPAAVDFIPQSTVADCLWCILREVADMVRGLGGRIITTIYDSILIQVPQRHKNLAAQKLKLIMEREFNNVAPGFKLPVEIEMGEPGASWGELKPYAMLSELLPSLN